MGNKIAALARKPVALRRYEVVMTALSGRVVCSAALNAENMQDLLKQVEEYYGVEMNDIAETIIKRVI